MIGKEYFSRQAATLLKLAQLTRDRSVAANLTSKAADLQQRSNETPLAPEMPPTAPDVQPR
jgi:hypothetical protein